MIFYTTKAQLLNYIRKNTLADYRIEKKKIKIFFLNLILESRKSNENILIVCIICANKYVLLTYHAGCFRSIRQIIIIY